MADSVREKFLQNVDLALQNITTLNGYNTNIGNNVLRTRIIGQIGELPSVGMVGQPSTPSDNGGWYQVDRRDMPIVMTGGVSINPSTDRQTNVEQIQKTGEQIQADIEKAFGTIDFYQPGATATKVFFNGGVELQAETQENEAAVMVAVQYTITYDTVKDDPYSQP